MNCHWRHAFKRSPLFIHKLDTALLAYPRHYFSHRRFLFLIAAAA
jgi:hypothetical protein